MQREVSLNPNKKKLENLSFKRSTYDGYKLKKDVVLYVVNRTILESGPEAFDMINRSLNEKYKCEISECFEKPEYLVDVLRYVFDGSYLSLIESLVKNLERFGKEDGIKEFLEALRQQERSPKDFL